jgi:hypothetical protein
LNSSSALKLARHRARGEPDGHEYAETRQDLLIMPLMELAVRYPKDGDVTKGPIKLLSIDPATSPSTRANSPIG